MSCASLLSSSPSQKDQIHAWLDRHGLLSTSDEYFTENVWEEIRQSSREKMSWDETVHVISFIASSKIPQDPWWDYFAASVLIADHKDRTLESFCDVVRTLQQNHDATGSPRPLLDDEFAQWILQNELWVERIFVEETVMPHFPISLFGWKTLYRSYLMRVDGQVVERPDHLWFRVALFLHRGDQEKMVQCFRDLRTGAYTHATPTLFYAGARRPQMASCFPWNAVVFTPHGGRPIGTIKAGDRVLTHHGKWKKVAQVHTDVMGQDRGLRRVQWKSSISRHVFEVTSDHAFLVNTNEWKKMEDIRPGADTFVHIHDILSIPSHEGIDDWIHYAGQNLVAFRRFYSQQDDHHMSDGTPNGLRRAFEEWIKDGKCGHFEHFLSEYALSWIPVILQGLLDTHGLEKTHSVWRETDDSYIRMWYEQWVMFTKYGVMDCNKDVVIEDLPLPKIDEIVYTLGVEDDHSYVVQGLVAQNCFLVGTDDSLEGIFKTISDVAQISKWAGGVGVHISNIRANRSYIYGTNGYSNGILPMIRLYNDTSRYIDQCFEASTRVWTKTCGWKPISDIRPNEDLVLTQTGQYKIVQKLISHAVEKQDMFRIWVDENRYVDVTQEHDVLMYPKSYPQGKSLNVDYDLHEPESYFPLSEWSADSRAVWLQPPIVQDRMKSPWTLAWVRTLRILLELSPVVLDPLSWHFGSSSIPVDFPRHPYCREMDGMAGLHWSKHVMFPWAWIPASTQKGFSPGIPYEWLTYGELIEEWRGEIMRIKALSHKLSSAWGLFLDSMAFLFSVRKEKGILVKKWYKVEAIPWKPQCHRVLYDLVVDGHPSYMTEIGVVHNGGGKRNGAFAMYMEPWHADIMAFLHAKKNTGPEEERARDLFYGLWIPDIFMKRVVSNDMWSLMCPKECPGLVESHSQAFDKLYTEYEQKQMYKRQIPARELFSEIIRCQIETGTPYFLYKDTCNQRSNQKHLGTIRSSNLCVTGNTLILTRDGYKPISRCVGDVVDVWNGTEFQPVTPLQTADRIRDGLIEIRTVKGKIIQCTPDHVFYLEDGAGQVSAQTLTEGDRFIAYTLPMTALLSKQWVTDIQRVIKYILLNAIRVGDNRHVLSEDMSSLQELHLNMELIKIPSRVLQGSPNTLQITGVQAWERLGCFGRDYQSFLKRMIDQHPVIIRETIDSVTRHATISVPVFCFREAVQHKAVFQGILAGQCTEIIEYSDAKEYAVCNLASLSLPNCCAPNPYADKVKCLAVNPNDSKNHHEIQWLLGRIPKGSPVTEDGSVERGLVRVTDVDVSTIEMMTPRKVWMTYFAPVFDFDKLGRLTRSLVVNLNAVIDQNRYPTPETRFSNLRHRPIGIGVQGLADVFCKMKIAFDSIQARQLNQDIFETIYFSALDASCEKAVADGPYATFKGSPLSVGQLHWEMTDQKPSIPMRFTQTEWDMLRQRIVRHGVRNSLMIAPMPTASTSQILNNNECFEPYTSNFYTRRTSVGEYLIYNKELFWDLRAMGMWTTDIRQHLLWTRGSVKDMIAIPDWIREVYRTVWEIPQKSIIDMASDRQFFIDQSQSMNLFMAEPNLETLTKMHIYGWRKGLKTGSYYIRSRPPMATPHFALDPHFRTTNPTKTESSSQAPKVQDDMTNTEMQKSLSSTPAPVVCPYRKRSAADAPRDDDDGCMACSA